MRVAGFGFRSSVTLAALRDALERAGGADGIEALATIEEKCGTTAFRQLAAVLGVRVAAIPRADLAGAGAVHVSVRVMARFGTGSVAEAAALVAAGPGARLVVGRVVAGDGTATAAIAEGPRS